MLIRPATALDHSTFARLFVELDVDEAPWNEARFAAEMVATTLIAEDQGQPVGYAFFRIVGDDVHVSQIAVAPGARRRGVGYALFNAIAQRARRETCTGWSLNVKRSNTGAIAFYEGFGLSRVYESVGVRVDWSTVKMGESRARKIQQGDDVRIEREMHLKRGQLNASRMIERVLLVLEDERHVLGAVVFDALSPTASPFRAVNVESAVELLRAIRSHARATDTFINVTLEDQAATASGLIAAGAHVRFETFHMAGPLPSR
jgi:GNAT superfamily N-acetyltransferase